MTTTAQKAAATFKRRVPGNLPAIAWTQSIVTLPAATSTQLVAADSSRLALRWMVTGTNPMTVVPGTSSAVVGQGLDYSGAAGVGQQGGSDSFVGSEITTTAFQAISTLGTTVTVWEGDPVGTSPPTGPTAPTLSIPTSTNPPVVPALVPDDAQTGDVITLYWSHSQSFASGIFSGTHTLNTAVDTPGSTITGFGIGTLSTGAPWYFRDTSTRSGNLGNPSNIVSWPLADTIPPTISTSGTQSVNELSTLAVALVASKSPVTWTITGGADQLQCAITGSTLMWYANGTQNADLPTTLNGTNVYVVIITATDIAGNVSSPLTISVTVNAIAKQPTFTPSTLTGINNATHGVTYTSASFSVSALATGLTIPGSIANGAWEKNGTGGFLTTPPTMTNGDSFEIQGSTTGTTIVTFTGSPGTHQRQITFTISDGAAQFANSGIDINSNVTPSGTPRLSYTTYGGSGNPAFVRANRVAATAHTYFEFTATHWNSGLSGCVGFDNRTDDFSATTSNIPGYNDNTGISMNAYNGLNINSGGTNVPITQPADGDVIGVEITASTIKFTDITQSRTLGSISNSLGTGAVWFFGGQDSGGGTQGITWNPTGPYIGTVPTGANNY